MLSALPANNSEFHLNKSSGFQEPLRPEVIDTFQQTKLYHTPDWSTQKSEVEINQLTRPNENLLCIMTNLNWQSLTP